MTQSSTFQNIMGLVPIFFAFAVMFVWMNYSAKKRSGERDQFLSKLERGTEVITTGGIYGRIEGLTETAITLEIAPGTRIRVLRSAIAGLAKNVTASSSSASTSGVKS